MKITYIKTLNSFGSLLIILPSRLKLRRCPFQDTSMKSSMDGYPVKQAKLVQITKNNSTMNVLGNRPEGTQESRREGNM